MKNAVYKIIFTTLISSLILINNTKFIYAQSQYVNANSHYSFTVPNNWSEIPKSIIDEYVAKVVELTNGKSIEYQAGFQLNQDNYFDYPYMLVQSRISNTPSYSQIEKSLNRDDIQNVTSEISEEYSELIKNATMEKPFLDKQRNLIFMNIQMDNINMDSIKGLTVMFLGKESITYLHFYSKSDDYNKWLPVFNSVIDSFQYDNGYKYTSKSIYDGAFEKGTVGLFTGAIAGAFVLVAGIYTNRKKVKDVK